MYPECTIFSSSFFPPQQCARVWDKTECRRYPRIVQARQVVFSFVGAFMFRCSSIQSVCERYGDRLGTQCVSTISKALNKPSFLAFTRCLMERLQAEYVPTRQRQAWALDSMPVTLPLTQRGQSAKYNNRCKGGGVMWSVNLDAPSQTSPICVLKLMPGAWNDSKQVQDVTLVANGPVYLIDRGFYCMQTLTTWVEQRVLFIMRAKKQYLSYSVLKHISKPRTLRNGIRIQLDAMVRIERKHRQASVKVRLIKAWLPDGKDLFLTTTLYDEDAQEILRLYKRRDRIEKFHQLLKDTIGMAHLYSFEDTGIDLLIEIAAMTAILLYMASGGCKTGEDTVRAIRRAFREIRKQLGLQSPWKRNTFAQIRNRSKRRNINSRRRSAICQNQ
jgi:hypothetical protein